MAYDKIPTKGGREKLRGEGDKIKFIGFGFERGQVVGFWTGRGT